MILEKNKHNSVHQKKNQDLSDFLTYSSFCLIFKYLTGIKEGGERARYLFHDQGPQSLNPVGRDTSDQQNPSDWHYHLGFSKAGQKAAEGH